jgi:hypothetical protein
MGPASQGYRPRHPCRYDIFLVMLAKPHDCGTKPSITAPHVLAQLAVDNQPIRESTKLQAVKGWSLVLPLHKPVNANKKLIW